MTHTTDAPGHAAQGDEGRETMLRALYIWDGDAGEHQFYVEGKSVDFTRLHNCNVVLGPYDARFVYFWQGNDDLTNALYDSGLIWSEEIRGMDYTDYDGGWSDSTTPEKWDALWTAITKQEATTDA